MHGYQPGEVEPTTELLLSHKHPEDRTSVAEAITRSLNSGAPFSSRHRVLDISGGEHHVMVVAGRTLDDSGVTVGTTGYYIDLSETIAATERETLDTVVPEVIEARAAIEQAKGALMLIYSISAEQAFKVLQWRSQETNTKLRDLAQALVAALPRFATSGDGSATAFDDLLLTIHQTGAPSQTATPHE
ncbi:PAS and ANTAR domain-containing protein [Nocardia sp. NPDC050435]|uniref:PAS and ANTAR domain-containing protein n=1 Tax=Nocardia sp. NPDC050435 TaxID=3155040 RepID=UPI00340AC56B